MALPKITLTGNAVADPTLKFISSGTAVANLRVACTDRRQNRQTGQWEDGDTVFLDVEVWNRQAENVAETIVRGTGVHVTGVLVVEKFTDREGNERSANRVKRADVAVALGSQTATVTRSSTQQAQSAPRQAQSAPRQARPAPQQAQSAPQNVLAEPPF